MLKPILLPACARRFMTFAWYGHRKGMDEKPLLLVILFSWGIAFFEDLLQLPADRIGILHFNLGQRRVIQEIFTMVVFAGFAFFCLKPPLKPDRLRAMLCLVGAACIIFRGASPDA